MAIQSPVIVALDFADQSAVEQFVAQLDPALCRVKVGKELFTRCGPAVVRYLVGKGFDVFLDLKFHDIPNTVAGAVKAAADLGVWMVNVHASGGLRMMEAAREALASTSQRPLLTAVTVLTSMSADDLRQLGIDSTPMQQVARLASLTRDAGLDGVVCSAQEAMQLRSSMGPGFVLVTPGIRPAGSEQGDQHRIATPASAIAAGSSYLVIGRPITGHANPAQALAAINAEIESLA